jgi:peptide/nickel transport system permease protein
MSPLISKEKRIIYSRRIKGFWEEFSHNKIGLVGLALLFLFVFVAIFAPWLSPYDPITAPKVAGKFAVPSWLITFPQYKDYSHTMEISPYWEINKTTEFAQIQWGKNIVIDLNMTDEVQDTKISLIANVNYPYIMPPEAFTLSFDFETQNITNLWYLTKISIINTADNSTLIWSEPYTNTTMRLSVNAESTDYWLLKKLGYLDPKITNIASMIFASPTKGDYTLVFEMSFRPTEEAKTAAAKVSLKNCLLFIPGRAHGILGTDFLGTDVFSQLIHGTRISLVIGLLAAAISTSIGVLLGVLSGYSGGAVDETLMRLVDILICLPVLPLLLILVKLFGKNIFYIVLFIAIFGWTGLARIIRSQVLSTREIMFVESAIASGASRYYIMIRHIIPNVFPIALASLVLSVPGAILAEAGLSFLGFGDPRVPTWGKMLNYAFGHGAFENFAWWWAVPPGIAITMVSLTFVFMGYAIDEVVNPRLRRRR